MRQTEDLRLTLGCLRCFHLRARVGITIATPLVHASMLFGCFSGTMRRSDSAPSCITAVPSWVLRADLGWLLSQGQWRRLPGPYQVFPCMPGVSDPAGPVYASPYRRKPCCLPRVSSASAPSKYFDFGAQYPACTFPLSTLRRSRRRLQRMIRGQCGWLNLHCR
jgi:hypothetical protein